VVKVPAQYTTQECSYCANREQFDARKEVRHRCSRCGGEWDQDENAARNLLKILRAVEVGGNEV
ncbi:MAG: zinc ribbon domain-containing protein, partial [Chloroflexota bacterium]|nr:zinc ribbon domain-containing protein [Chloroflexota bacterium]